MTTDLSHACVIGAGSSGIAAAKALHERGIPFDCYEKSDRVGGNWVFANKNGMSSAYRSLHINTSRERMEYSDFPMPPSYPDFPHHTTVQERNQKRGQGEDQERCPPAARRLVERPGQGQTRHEPQGHPAIDHP